MQNALELPKLSKKSSFKGSGKNWKEKYFQRQSLRKYLRLTLVFIRNSALWKKFSFCFQEIFAGIKKKSFLQKNWALGCYSMKSRHFSDISYFSRILSLKWFGNSQCYSFILCLWGKTTHGFTCGKSKIW